MGAIVYKSSLTRSLVLFSRDLKYVRPPATLPVTVSGVTLCIGACYASTPGLWCGLIGSGTVNTTIGVTAGTFPTTWEGIVPDLQVGYYTSSSCSGSPAATSAIKAQLIHDCSVNRWQLRILTVGSDAGIGGPAWLFATAFQAACDVVGNVLSFANPGPACGEYVLSGVALGTGGSASVPLCP
jgi:hypothetical protein